MNSSLMSSFALGPLCALISSFTWAVGSAGYSRMSRTHSAFAVNFARAMVALPLFLIAAFLSAGGLRAGWSDFSAVRAEHFGWFALSMFASYGLGDVLFMWSTRSLGVPGALAIASAYPLWTALAGYFFQGEALSAFQVAGLILATAGITVVILNGPKEMNGTPGESKAIGRGVLLALSCSVLWALNSFSVARGGRDLSAPVGNTVRMVFALGLSAAFGKLLLPSQSLLLPGREFKRFLWLFGLEAFGGSYLFMYGLSHSPLAIGSTLASLAPVISVPVAWALKLEKFSLPRTLGVSVVMLGIWLLIAMR